MEEGKPEDQDTPKVNDEARYAEYWAYLRHVERLRFQLASVVMAVSVAALGFLMESDDVSDEGRIGVLFGLAIFVFAALMFLVRHKGSYRTHFDRTNSLDGKRMRNLGPGPDDPFYWLLAAVSVLEAGIVAYLGLAVASLSNEFCGVLTGVIVFGLAIVFPWYSYLKEEEDQDDSTSP